MEARLHGLETLLLENNKMLRTLMGQGLQTPPLSSLAPIPKTARTGVTLEVDMNKDTSRPFDGETSLMAHSRKARRVVEHLLQSTPSMSSDPEVIHALKTLQTAMEGPSRTGTSLLRPDMNDEHRKCSRETLPPHEFVLEVLRGAQAADCLFFSIWLPFFSPAEFVHLCDRLYSDFDSCSLAIKTTLYGALHYMFVEYLSACKTPFESIYWSYAQTFKLNFEDCLRRCSILSIPTFDNVLALVLGAGHAIQVSEYASAWPMVSAAANMAQALGWHRLSDSYTRETEAQRILFWLTYYFDKCLSLRLGRSSNIQEFDITGSYPKAPVQSEYRSWHLWFMTLIDIAAAHGLIYEHLFSPGSMRQSSKQRSQRVLELAARLDSIQYKSASIVDATVYRRQYMIYLLKSNAVVIGCLRTLIYRAASSSEEHAGFNVDVRSLLAARSTLHSHQDVIEHIRDRHDGSANDYANWTILNCPFTPFIVLFCHVIVSFDMDDLKLMEAFTISLESLSMRTTTSMVNFRVLCEAFLLLATRYIRLSTGRSQDPDMFLASNTDKTHATTPSDPEMSQVLAGGMDISNNALSFLPPGILEKWLSGSQDFEQYERIGGESTSQR
jgi:hypothetical protein